MIRLLISLKYATNVNVKIEIEMTMFLLELLVRQSCPILLCLLFLVVVVHSNITNIFSMLRIGEQIEKKKTSIVGTCWRSTDELFGVSHLDLDRKVPTAIKRNSCEMLDSTFGPTNIGITTLIPHSMK